ncbi:hypothetical protein F0Q45_11040, partial [Mycobacterium simiae]
MTGQTGEPELHLVWAATEAWLEDIDHGGRGDDFGDAVAADQDAPEPGESDHAAMDVSARPGTADGGDGPCYHLSGDDHPTAQTHSAPVDLDDPVPDLGPDPDPDPAGDPDAPTPDAGPDHDHPPPDGPI